MKIAIKIAILLMAIIFSVSVGAKEIRITKFEMNPTSLIAKFNPIKDLNGEAGALIRFYVPDNDFDIVPIGLGVLKKDTLPGEIQLWVPKGTKKITIKHRNDKPLLDYKIPLLIEPENTYDVTVEVTEEPIKNHNVYVGIGYNITPITGPAATFGFNINHHNVEIGFDYGLSKTDDLFFYDSNSNIVAAYHYKLMRAKVKYGYSIKVAEFLEIVPQIGGSFNFAKGTESNNYTNSNAVYKNAHYISICGNVKIVAALNDYVKLQVSPGCDFSVYKNNNGKLISWYDKTFMDWTKGFNLNVGLMFYF